MVVHPATSHQAGTLVNALLHHCGDSLQGVGGERRPGIVHRLDKDTSGVMVVAKDEPTLVGLQTQFARARPRAQLRRHRRGRGRRARQLQDQVRARSATTARSSRRRCSRASARSPTGACASGWPARRWSRCSLETGRDAPDSRALLGRRPPLIGDRTYGRPPREPALRARRADAGSAGAARARARPRASGDGPKAALDGRAAGRFRGGAGGAARLTWPAPRRRAADMGTATAAPRFRQTAKM